MSIRKKTLLIMFSTFVLMGSFILGVTRLFLLTDYIRLETQDMTQTISLVSRQMEDDLSYLKSISADWGPWDDTYQFIEDLNEDYINRNLLNFTIANLKLNFMIFVNASGEISFCKEVDLQDSEIQVDCHDAAGLIKRYPAVLRSQDRQDLIVGYGDLNGRATLLAAAPILTSDFQGPVRGTLILGKYLNPPAIDLLQEKIRLPLRIEKIGPGSAIKYPSSGQAEIKRPDESTITATLFFKSLSESPLFTIDIKKERTIYLQGKRTLNNLLLICGIIGLFSMAVMMIFIEKAVLFRLSRLSRKVNEIAMKPDDQIRLNMPGKDEISSLSSNINHMLETISEKEKKYKLLFDSSTDAILLIKGGMIQDCNHRTFALLGLEENELIGRDPSTLLPQHQPDGHLSEAQLRKSLEMAYESPSLTFEWTFSGRGREAIEAEVSLNSVDLPSGRYIQVTIRDITDRKKNQQIIAQTEKMISLGGIAAGMAHEINNPLAGMIQNAQVLENRMLNRIPANIKAALEVGMDFDIMKAYMDKREIPKFLGSITQAGEKASKIVENMLKFVRRDNSEKKEENVIGLLENTIELAGTNYNLTSKYDFKRVKIIREYADAELLVTCHAGNLQQVFFNLLKNAADAMFFSETRNQEPKLTLRVYKIGEESVRIEIEDNGPGIDEKMTKNIFEPFFTTKKTGEGTGLGLSISYFIITKDHGGRISVESEPGKGSIFIIDLPLKE